MTSLIPATRTSSIPVAKLKKIGSSATFFPLRDPGRLVCWLLRLGRQRTADATGAGQLRVLAFRRHRKPDIVMAATQRLSVDLRVVQKVRDIEVGDGHSRAAE